MKASKWGIYVHSGRDSSRRGKILTFCSSFWSSRDVVMFVGCYTAWRGSVFRGFVYSSSSPYA